MKHLITWSWLVAVAASAVPFSAAAQGQPTPQNLPSTEQAAAWIESDPTVVQARAAMAAAEHAGAAIATSSHEWTARVQGQRRNYRDVGANSNEWTAQLERPIRINGKGGLDRQLADLEREIARARVGEARHEAARALAGLWMEVIAARGQEALLREQMSFAESSLAAVDKRKRAGDASVLDVNIAQTDLGEVQRQASIARTQLVKALAKLKVRFPAAEPAAAMPADPGALPLAEAAWRERVLAEADPLKVSEGEFRRAQTTAARVRADRVPDPTFGVYMASEAQRNERVVGVSISMPLSGRYRDQRSLQAEREADTARAAVDLQRRLLEVEAAETYAEAEGSAERWRVSERSAAIARESARLTQRAYTLGEADLQSLLLVRRQSLDASRAALEARTDALRWQHRVLIDAHLIWDLEND